ncbi:MAG: hypothetical protein WCS37_06475 [Chloroflexota bacterium]|nr:hypothetical protein [Chloroflexota bacterium]
MGFLSRDKKDEPNRTELIKLEEERFLLSNLQRGTEIGDFVAVCRTDYVQTFSDAWIARFDYQWAEYLLLVKNLLQKPDDLSALVYLPQDLSEVYYVVVPSQTPNHTYLTAKGRADYELSPGYEAAVDAALAKDYASLPKRSVFHSVDPQQSGWDLIVNAVLAGEMQSVALEYNGVKYVYKIPTDKKEAEASAFTALATRYGSYPMEESLRTDRKFDIVPSIPNRVTGRVTVREFVTDPKVKPPFERISFQRSEVPPGSVPADQPTVMTTIAFGNDLDPNESLSKYLSLKYVQIEQQNPVVKMLGQF